MAALIEAKLAQGSKSLFASQVLTQLAQDLGCVGIWYCYDVLHPEQWQPLAKNHNTAIRRFVRRRSLYGSSAAISMLWQQQMLYYHKLQEVMQGIWQNEIYFWPMQALSEPMLRALGHAGVQSLVTLTVRCPITPEFRGRFTLLIAAPQSEEYLLDLESITTALELAQRDLAIQLAKTINPLVDYKIVSPMSVYILKLMVTGHARSEISSQLRLSAGGINYHLNLLKQSLGSYTTAQLVYRATQLQLI